MEAFDVIQEIRITDRHLTLKANQLSRIHNYDRISLELLPSVQDMLNQIGEINHIERIDLKTYNELQAIVSKWQQFFAGLRECIEIPCIPPTRMYQPSILAKHTPRLVLRGKVIKRSGSKTIKVEVVNHLKHPKYSKTISKTKKYLVHDENERACIGDQVLIVACRPISKRKAFRLFRILSRSRGLHESV